jgi:DNA-binding beta-propeller fold protein YncE
MINTPLRRLVAFLGIASLAGSAFAQSYAMFQKDALPMIQRSVLPADTEGRMGEIGYDPTSQCMYFAAHGANTLHVLDPAGMNTIQSIKDLNEPNGIAISNDLRRLFLTCGDGTVHIYKIEDAKGPVPVPGQPPAAGFEPGGKLTEIKVLNVPGEADGVRFDPKTKHLYVAHGKFVSWIDPTGFGPPANAAPAAAPAADDYWAKVGADATELYRLAQQKAAPEDIRKVATTLQQHAAADPSAKPAAAEAASSGGGSDAKFARLQMPGPVKGITVSPDGSRVYANIPSLSQVVVIDTAKWAIDATWDLKNAGGNYPLVTDDSGQFLFVACRQPSCVLMLDTSNGAEKDRFSIDNDDATNCWWDARGKRIYVSSGNGNGTVSMIWHKPAGAPARDLIPDRTRLGDIDKLLAAKPADAAALEKEKADINARITQVMAEAGQDMWLTEHNVPTAPGARTSILIPEKGRFIVTAPKLTYPPFVFIYLTPTANEHHNYTPAEH